MERYKAFLFVKAFMHAYIGSDFVLLLLLSLMKKKAWDAAHLNLAQMGPFFIFSTKSCLNPRQKHHFNAA